jgi:hypothetical protein
MGCRGAGVLGWGPPLPICAAQLSNNVEPPHLLTATSSQFANIRPPEKWRKKVACLSVANSFLLRIDFSS